MAENIVFNEIHGKEADVYYWRADYETDFLLKEKNKVTKAIQVCWNIEKEETKEREVNGLIEACKKFKLKEGLIITEDYEGEEKTKGIKVRYTPLWKWLLQQ